MDIFPPDNLTYFLAERFFEKITLEGLFTAPDTVISSKLPVITILSPSFKNAFDEFKLLKLKSNKFSFS